MAVGTGVDFLRTVSKREAFRLVQGGTWDVETFNNWCNASRFSGEPREQHRLPDHDWQTDKGDNAVTVHSKVVGGVLCRWWGDGAPPAGVARIDAAAAEPAAKPLCQSEMPCQLCGGPVVSSGYRRIDHRPTCILYEPSPETKAEQPLDDHGRPLNGSEQR